MYLDAMSKSITLKRKNLRKYKHRSIAHHYYSVRDDNYSVNFSIIYYDDDDEKVATQNNVMPINHKQ